MSIELALLLSGASVIFGIWSGLITANRNEKTDTKHDASVLTTVIVKLENISTGITEMKNEIKNEMTNIKSDIKETRERVISIESSTDQAHKRLDNCERYCRRFDEQPIEHKKSV